MRALNERLQKMQQEQAARQDALQTGRIKVERAERDRGNADSDERQKNSE